MIAPRQDIRRAIGHLIICGFDGSCFGAELKEILREVRPLGLIFFARNVESPAQLADLGRELKQYYAPEPLLLSIDQEGGRVARVLSPATEWPPLATLGKIANSELSEKYGTTLAMELRAMNIDINFAPVLDVNTNPLNPVIGDRSFSADPNIVAELGAAFIRGLQLHGIAACGKHFPGHGDTRVDSHFELPYVEHDVKRLENIEWIPFRHTIQNDLQAIMTAHVVMTAIDDQYPATLSSKVLGFLRKQLAFQGLIFSDDIEMKALTNHYNVDQIARLGLKAGVDVFLVCHEPETILQFYRALVVAWEQKEISSVDIMTKEQRILKWRHRFFQPPVVKEQVKQYVGHPTHLALARDIIKRGEQLSTI